MLASVLRPDVGRNQLQQWLAMRRSRPAADVCRVRESGQRMPVSAGKKDGSTSGYLRALWLRLDMGVHFVRVRVELKHLHPSHDLWETHPKLIVVVRSLLQSFE